MTEAPTKQGWRNVTLGEIFEISSSKRVLRAQWRRSGVPFYRAREIVKLAKHGVVENELFISEELFDEYRERYGVPSPGDLMVSAVGTLGACYVVQPQDRFYYKDASVLRFSPREGVHSKFIQYAFSTSQILDQVHGGSGSTVGTFTIERANKTRMTLPPLAEQRRIAAILDKADELRARRRAALAQLDALTESTFLDMFGDPATNPKGWPRMELKDLFDIARGGSPRPIDAFITEAEDGVNWILIGDASGGDKYITKTKKRIRPEGASRSRAVKPGDFLLTNSMSFGRPYIMQTSGCIHDGWLVLSPRTEDFEPAYFYTLLGSRAVFAEFERRAPGATVKNLNIDLVRSVVVPVAPASKQKEFGRAVTAIERATGLLTQSLMDLDHLFATLQHRAFRGDL